MFILIFCNVHLDTQELELNPCLCVILLVACFGGGVWRDFVIREVSSEAISFQFEQECKFSFEGRPGSALCSASLHYLHYLHDHGPCRRPLNKSWGFNEMDIYQAVSLCKALYWGGHRKESTLLLTLQGIESSCSIKKHWQASMRRKLGRHW